MNMSQFAAINRSLNSQEGSPIRPNINQSTVSFNNSFARQVPHGGGMLKPSMRFEYEFSSPRKNDEGSTLKKGPTPKEVGMFKLNAVEQPKKQNNFFSANLFSCMDGTQYERDFEVSPGLLAKE